jgi:hypothetical protein
VHIGFSGQKMTFFTLRRGTSTNYTPLGPYVWYIVEPDLGRRNPVSNVILRQDCVLQRRSKWPIQVVWGKGGRGGFPLQTRCRSSNPYVWYNLKRDLGRRNQVLKLILRQDCVLQRRFYVDVFPIQKWKFRRKPTLASSILTLWPPTSDSL